MQPDNATESIEEIRRQAIAVLQDLITKSESFELPKPPEALGLYHRKLWANEYKVLVVGEAKRGKSTFVNALIGRDILPTAVDVATSQVFRINPSDQEGYRLRFEDGSSREISREDLPLYGSQVVADSQGVPPLDRMVRWIEADVPARFLPKNVSILDTPGLGGMYASHAQITHRFVPEADAVIFVLESGQPIGNDELNLVEEILGVTRNLFFVQTKIDLFNKEQWQATLRRSQEILAKRFKGRLLSARLWPVSSTNLRKAALENDRTSEAYLMVSRHRELEKGLKAFLARVAGWRRAADAMLAAAEYQRIGHKVLSGRLAGSSTGSSAEQSDLHRAAAQHKQRFDADWGPRGQKRRELTEQLRKTIFVGKQGFLKYIQPGGSIEVAQRAKIDRITSLGEANRVAKEMPEEVTLAAIKGWLRISKGVQDRCAELLGPFAEDVERVSAPVKPKQAVPTVLDSGPGEKFKHNYSMMLRSVLTGGIMLGGAATIGNMLLTNAMIVALASPAAFVAGPAVVVVAGAGIKGVIKGQVESAKQELKGRLRETLLRVQGYFFDVHLPTGRLSHVDECFKSIERNINERVEDLARQKSREAQDEIQRLTDTSKQNDRQREAQSERIRQQVAEWNDLGKRTKDVMLQIKALKEAETAPVQGRFAVGEV